MWNKKTTYLYGICHTLKFRHFNCVILMLGIFFSIVILLSLKPSLHILYILRWIFIKRSRKMFSELSWHYAVVFKNIPENKLYCKRTRLRSKVLRLEKTLILNVWKQHSIFDNFLTSSLIQCMEYRYSFLVFTSYLSFILYLTLLGTT